MISNSQTIVQQAPNRSSEYLLICVRQTLYAATQGIQMSLLHDCEKNITARTRGFGSYHIDE